MGITFGIVITATSGGGPLAVFIVLILIFGMLTFTGLVIFINAIFNRNKR